MASLDMAEAGADLRSDDRDRQARGVEAVEALHRRGDPEAAYAIGSWLLAGVHGYARSEEEAAAYLQYAADRHVRDAIFDLGVLVERRKLGKKSRREAFNRYLTAAILGDRSAAYEVVRCLFHGIGTFADPSGAERLNEALSGDGGAQRPLAAE